MNSSFLNVHARQESGSVPRRLRLGIVGCGLITETAHLPAALSSPLVELAAICDTDLSRVQSLINQYGLRTIGSGDYREVLSAVDAVILSVPNSLHATIGVDCLSRGIHVLCEKPLAVSRGECQDLCDAARHSSTKLAVGYMTRFYPSTRLTKQLIDSEFLGHLASFSYEFGTDGGWAPVSGYNLARATAGGGVLTVSGSHFLDRMLYFFDDIRLLDYADDSHGGLEANCLARFSAAVNGTPIGGVVTLSKTHRLSNQLRLVGDRGELRIREGQVRSVQFVPADGDIVQELAYRSAASRADEDYYRLQLEDFVRAIQLGHAPAVTGEAGMASVALIEECYERKIALDEPWYEATLERFAAALPPAEATPS